MVDNNLNVRIPVGVRDILPDEAKRKRDVENTFANIVRGWGYDEVVTPTYEYYDTLITGQSQKQEEAMLKFLDRKGRIMALRSDMTTPIARLVATKMADIPLPLKLFYLANVFGYEDPQAGRQREFYQAGIELIGSSSADADGEVIAIAVETLKSAGLDNFQINLGQIEVFNGLMEELKLPENKNRNIRAAISNKDFVHLEEMLEETALPKNGRERVLKLLGLRGGKEIINEARDLTDSPRANMALQNLNEVFEVLETYGVSDKVSIDLGLLRGFDYYTGIVFEGYTPAIGFPICGGGRYDRLIGQFGYPCDATGFALGIERLLIALEKEKSFEADILDYYIQYNPEKRAEAFAKAKDLRGQGFRVETELQSMDSQQREIYLNTKKFNNIIKID